MPKKTLDVFTYIEPRVTDDGKLSLTCRMSKQVREVLSNDRDMKTKFRERVLKVCAQTLRDSAVAYEGVTISGLFSSVTPISLLIWIKDSAMDSTTYLDTINLCEKLKIALGDIKMQVSFSFP